EPPDEWRAVKDCLYVGTRQLACSLVSHGFTITLPNTIRSSSNLKASFVSGNASSRSMIGLSLPELMRSKRVVRSSRIQPLEPRILSSNVQMYRRSSFGSKPAVAPQVRSRPCLSRALSQGTHRSPPAHFT